MKSVNILMATYRGESYLKDQIESIINQTFHGWKLFVHDDGSTDQTLTIVKGYQERFPDRIKIIDDGVKCGGAKENFSHLMRFIDSDYVMFADQDDIWLPDKVELTLAKMLECERDHPGIPIVVHSDLKVVSDNLDLISESMFKEQRLNYHLKDLTDILVTNSVTGCTMMINSRVIAISPSIPKDAVMHDWWLACVTLKNDGMVVFLEKPLMLYRQHAENTIGYHAFGWLHLVNKLQNIKLFVRSLISSFKQAEALGYHNKFWLLYLKFLHTINRLLK